MATSKSFGVMSLILLFSALFFPIIKIGNMGLSPVYFILHLGELSGSSGSSMTSGGVPGISDIAVGVALMFIALIAGVMAVDLHFRKDNRKTYIVVLLFALLSIVEFSLGYSSLAHAMVKSLSPNSLGDLTGLAYVLIGPGDAILLEAFAAALAGAAFIRE